MSGIQLNTTVAPTFSQIEQRFSVDQGGKDHNIRFQDGKGLYTSDKASLASVKAFFGFPDQLNAREAKREAGVDQIKQSIDREYGAGMGDRVLQHISDEHGKDLSGGIKRSDLGMLREAVEHLRTQDRDAALNDPNIKGFDAYMNHTKVQAFMGEHFEVMSSPAFWSQTMAQVNADNLGSSLALNVLNRIVEQGSASPKDLEDLHRVLGPYVGKGSTPAPDVPSRLQGPMTEQKLTELTRIVYDRYFAPEAPVKANLSEPQDIDLGRVFSQPTSTGEDRLNAMNRILEAALGTQGMAPNTVGNLLKGMDLS